MSAPRKHRLLMESLGEQEGEMPAAEGVLTTVSLVLALLLFVAFAG